MMKYRKGCRVEVLNKRELPSVSWRCGKILSGNGHTYNVQYDYIPSPDAQPIIERVPRKSIRPPPPLLQDSTTPWLSGDIVEVFHHGSWRLAQVHQPAVGGDQYRLRLLGSSTTELSASTSDLRARQVWNGDRWVVIQIKPRNCDGGSHYKSPPGTCLVDAADMEGDKNHPPPPLVANADAVAPPCTGLGKRRRHASSSNVNCKSARVCEREVTVKREIDCVDAPSPSCCSSVGSCSANYSPPQYSTARHPTEDADISDAESYCGTRRRGPPTSAEEDCGQERIHSHSRELKEYCSSLSEFYASGPLDWEKEVALTDLRLALHISNDEHLFQLKCLKVWESFPNSPFLS